MEETRIQGTPHAGMHGHKHTHTLMRMRARTHACTNTRTNANTHTHRHAPQKVKTKNENSSFPVWKEHSSHRVLVISTMAASFAVSNLSNWFYNTTIVKRSRSGNLPRLGKILADQRKVIKFYQLKSKTNHLSKRRLTIF